MTWGRWGAFCLLWSFLVTPSLWSQATKPWILQKGPIAVTSIPVNPVQIVPAWKALYSDGQSHFWVYSTTSVFFEPLPPMQLSQWRVEYRLPSGLTRPCSFVWFFPLDWTPSQWNRLVDRFVKEYRLIDSLPEQGYPMVFPAVLNEGNER